MGTRASVQNTAGDKVKSWKPDDYLRVSCAMLPLLERGMHRKEAIAIAQRLLPAEKHRPENRLRRNLVSEIFQAEMARAKKMSPAQRAAMVARMPAELRAQLAPPKVTKDGRKWPSGNIRHTETELALIARRIAHFQMDLKDTRPLSRLYKVAQAIELPPERQRGSQSIDVCMSRIRSKLVRVHALRDILLKGIPFEANRREYIAAGDAAEPADPIDFAAEAADTLPVAKAVPKATPQEAPAPVQAPTPAPIPRTPPSDAIRAFGETFSQGMHDLIHSMTREMMGELELRMSQMSERLMQRTVETLAAGVGGLVHSALERELGSIAAPDAEAAPMALPNGSALPKALQLDVVGLIGHQVTEVKQQLNGYAAGIRFIDADEVKSWTPRASVILNTKFISHNADAKCRKAGVKPIRVQGGAGAILNALRVICENEGISLPH